MAKSRNRPRTRKHSRTPKVKRGAKPVALVDVCVPVFGEWGLLAKAIGSLEQATKDLAEGYRLIVVDNGTPDWQTDDGQTITAKDQSAPIKELLRPQDQFVRLDQNAGYPGGCNTAVSKGRSPLILIFTADVYLHENAITKMVKGLDDPQVGIVSPMLLFPTDESPHGPPGTVQHAGLAFDIRGDPFHIYMGWSPDHPKANQRREMQAVTGACFLTRRSLWRDTGGFSEIYGQGTFEDIEYCFQVRERGFKVIFEPGARGEHYVGGSIRHGATRGGFNLGLNATIFRGRWAQRLVWDTYLYY